MKSFETPFECCPNPKGREVIDRITGEIKWEPHSWRNANGEIETLRCQSNSCDGCLAINVMRIAGAIQLAEPTFWISLTLVGPSSAVITPRLRTFRHLVAEEVPGFQHAWAAEENPAFTGVHTHGFAHTGVRVREMPERVIQRAARRSGLGVISKIGRMEPDAPLSFYEYPMEDALDPERVERFWELNGSPDRKRLIHASRGFWRDGPLGLPIRRAEAVKIAYRRSRTNAAAG